MWPLRIAFHSWIQSSNCDESFALAQCYSTVTACYSISFCFSLHTKEMKLISNLELVHDVFPHALSPSGFRLIVTIVYLMWFDANVSVYLFQAKHGQRQTVTALKKCGFSFKFYHFHSIFECRKKERNILLSSFIAFTYLFLAFNSKNMRTVKTKENQNEAIFVGMYFGDDAHVCIKHLSSHQHQNSKIVCDFVALSWQ